VSVENKIAALELSVGAIRARVNHLQPMEVDLADDGGWGEDLVEVRVERDETVVPGSPLVGPSLDDVFNANVLDRLIPIEEVVPGAQVVRDFGAEEERQGVEMRASGYQEANQEADRLVRAGRAPVEYSQTAPDGHVDLPPPYVE
jgi:hypothetical protein